MQVSPLNWVDEDTLYNSSGIGELISSGLSAQSAYEDYSGPQEVGATCGYLTFKEMRRQLSRDSSERNNRQLTLSQLRGN